MFFDVAEPGIPGTCSAYRYDPVGYCTHVLGVRLTAKQEEICRALVKHKRVAVLASHGVGKSFLAAVLACWFFDCWENSRTITTAPTAKQVSDVIWAELRSLRRNADLGDLLPKAPRMERGPDWFAVGMTAATGHGFQGRHSKGGVFLEFDEAPGIKPEFYESGEGMMVDEESCYWLAIGNPTDPSCKLKSEIDLGNFHIIQVSALEHDNVIHQLENRPGPLPFPGAVTLGWVTRAIKAWTSEVPGELHKAGDFLWQNKWYRPTALFEGRVLGRFPSKSINTIWTDALWEGCLIRQPESTAKLEVGVDVARFGDDHTSIILRRGGTALHHETYQGQDITWTFSRIGLLVREFLRGDETWSAIPIKVDDDGVGGGLSDVLIAEGYMVERVMAGTVAMDPLLYPLKRDELWFSVADMAADLLLDFSRLHPESLALLKAQLGAVRYRVDGRGRRVVESKDDLKNKKRLGRSPDDADALNLAFAPYTQPGSILVGGYSNDVHSYVRDTFE